MSKVIHEIVNNNKENIKDIIIIQKYVRRYLTRKYILIPSSYYQTKKWRKSMSWYINGKSNECEKYQLNLIEKIILIKLMKTNDRINMETNEIISKKNIMKNNDGYEWSENFDALIIKNNNTYYFNLKFVCDNGGAQTRTLRESYHFIKYQMKYLIKFNTNNVYFINILDGDTCYNNMNKFNFLINKVRNERTFGKEKYKNLINFIFIGSLCDFQKNRKKFQLI